MRSTSSSQDPRYLATLRADDARLSDPARAYPVVIDPPITLTDGGTGYRDCHIASGTNEVTTSYCGASFIRAGVKNGNKRPALNVDRVRLRCKRQPRGTKGQLRHNAFVYEELNRMTKQTPDEPVRGRDLRLRFVSHPESNVISMESNPRAEAIRWLEKANAELEPELMTSDAARGALADYARIEKLASYGRAALARKIDDATALARTTGTSVGKAKQTVEVGKRLAAVPEVDRALKGGDISLDQAAEISKAEEAQPGSVDQLLAVAREEPFHVLRDNARRVCLEAEQTRGLGERQRNARRAGSHTDDLGMVNIHLALEPHVGTPIVNRAEAAFPHGETRWGL